MMMGGGAILIVSKKWPLFVQRLSVFLFFRELQKIRPPARKKIRGKLWAGPPIFDGTLGDWNRPPVSFKLKDGAKQYHGRPYPIRDRSAEKANIIRMGLSDIYNPKEG